MERYKICPSCGEKNRPQALECIKCETDLTGVRVTDKATQESIKAMESPSETVGSFRICDCGAKNPSNARKCSVCGEDISDVLPCNDITVANNYKLSSIDGKYVFELTDKETVVGRDNKMSEYLCSKSYVSRSHCKFIIEGNDLYVENLSNTNFTFINNKKILERTKLSDGDEIGLGGINKNGEYQSDAAYFILRIN